MVRVSPAWGGGGEGRQGARGDRGDGELMNDNDGLKKLPQAVWHKQQQHTTSAGQHITRHSFPRPYHSPTPAHITNSVHPPVPGGPWMRTRGVPSNPARSAPICSTAAHSTGHGAAPHSSASVGLMQHLAALTAEFATADCQKHSRAECGSSATNHIHEGMLTLQHCTPL